MEANDVRLEFFDERCQEALVRHGPYAVHVPGDKAHVRNVAIKETALDRTALGDAASRWLREGGRSSWCRMVMVLQGLRGLADVAGAWSCQ